MKLAQIGRGLGCALVVVGTLLVGSRFDAASPSAADRAFDAFWSAPTPDAAAHAADEVVRAGPSLDDALARLKRGRPYSSRIPHGEIHRTRRSGEIEFPYTLDVPESYDASRRYQVRVQLHGGVARPTPRTDLSIGSLAGAEQIYVLPTAWRDQPWWSDAQLDNIAAILDEVKRTYNVDENRVVLSGVSDGATSTYFVAMRSPTPFASFLPLNGYIKVLADPDLRTGALYPNNLLNKPFYIVNGGRDPLYPLQRVQPYVEHLRRGGVNVTFRPQADGVHNTAWWPDVKDDFEAFVRDHPRDPLSRTLTWETNGRPGTTRIDWLVVDQVTAAGDTTPAGADLNDFVSGTELNFGVRSAGMRVTAVTPGSNAATFGLRAGDFVLAVNGRDLPAGVDLVDLLSITDNGARVTLRVSRGDQTVDLSGTYSPTRMPRVVPILPRARPPARIDLVRDGNTVRATTAGVGAFTLLVSPDAFDLSRPVTVVADGRTVYDAKVTPSLETLMRWAARDNDRTMLFVAEIHVTLAGS